MSLVEALRSLRGVEDLPRIAAILGSSPGHQELPPTLLPVRRAAIVGRHGSFEWIGGEGGLEAGRRIAHGYLSRGRPAGVLLIDPDSRRLTLTVAASPVPSLSVSLDDPEPMALARLMRCVAVEGESGAATALRLGDALLGRGADYRFFRAFRRALGALAGALPGSMPARDRHAFALLQLTRILFLYFVEAKGWLAGRPRFIREEVDRCLGARRKLHRDLLRPLFFGTLNRPADERRAVASRFGDLPFLNGGLFEPHTLERRWKVDLPNPLLRDAFDELFERFHFTLAPDTGESIAPDMLGRVFEGVMEPDERHRTGTYYTPAPLVDSVLSEALAAWLEGHGPLASDAGAVRVRERSRPVTSALRGIRILDPAAGSGAFLLGALRLLARSDASSRDSARRVRRILSRNLYGVDRNPAAVRLAELRLWLEVIAADPGERPSSVEPLPNLDAVVRQGDSLLDPLAGLPYAPARGEAKALGPLRAALMNATGDTKRRALAALRRREREVALAQLEGAIESLGRQIADILERADSTTLFGGRAGLDRAGTARLGELRRRLHLARARLREVRDSDAVPWFHYATHFGDAMASGGFDLVVGNPPWVRAEALAADERRFLSERYRWFAARGRTPGYRHPADLSVAFLERSLELLAPGGVLAFLVPSKLGTTGYAATARAELARTTTLLLAADLTARRPGFEATVYPMVLVARKTRASPAHRVRLCLGQAEPTVPQSELAHARGSWALAGGPARAVLARLQAEFPALGTRFASHLGVKTGHNRAFLDPPADVEPALVRWAIRGRDVAPFRAAPSVRLLWPCDPDGRPLLRLPARAAAHLGGHLGALRRRADLGGDPPWALFRTGPATRPHRIIWADLTRRLEAVPLVGEEPRRWIPLNTCYTMPVRDDATALRLAAWLNTTWCRRLAAMIADPASSGFLRMNARVVSDLPLPDGVQEDRVLPGLAEQGLAGTLEQQELDARGAELLGLCREERDALAGLAPDRTASGG